MIIIVLSSFQCVTLSSLICESVEYREFKIYDATNAPNWHAGLEFAPDTVLHPFLTQEGLQCSL